MFLFLAQASEKAVTEAGQQAGETAAANGGETPPFNFSDPHAWQQLALDYLPSVVAVLIILLVAFVLAGILSRVATASLRRSRVDETVAMFTGKLVRWGIMLVALIICMAQFGVNTTSLAAMLAGIGFAVALAFQGTLSSFASGLFLMMLRPFKVGDTVKLAGETALVAEIDIFNTFLDTFDNRRIIMPNSSVFGSTIENLTYHPIRRADVTVRISFEADVDRTREVLKQAAEALPQRIDERDYAVALTGIEEWSLTWAVRVWVKTPDYWTARDALAREVKIHLDEAGLPIALPRRDVHMSESSAE